MRDVFQDLKHGVRFWRKSPLFTLFALATIALGVGATTAIFAVVEGVLLRPLPFRDPGELVALWEMNPERDWMFNVVAPANYLDWRERVSSFEDVTSYSGGANISLSGQGEPEMLSGAYVTGNFFSVLGVEPGLGRGFSMEETWEGAGDVVVLSHGLWQRRFGSDPAVVGRRIVLDGEPVTVVGVAPRGFDFPDKEGDLWMPFGWKPEYLAEVWFRRAHFLRTIARLGADATVESAGAELEAIASQLEREYPDTNRSMGAGLTPLHDWITGDTRRPLVVMLAAVGLVLLGACANLGNLLLARATARSQEMAIRGALGAGRIRLVRQLLLESVLLAAAGGIVALLIARTALPLLVASLPSEIPRTGEVSFGGPVLFFGFLASCATALAFGLVPALQASRASLGITMRESGRGLTRLKARARRMLVVSEVALAVVLATGAGLLLKSFLSLLAVPTGFEAAGVWSATVSLPYGTYDDDAKRRGFHAELLETLSALPGVRSAAAADHLPLTGIHYTTDFVFEGRPVDEVGVEFGRRIVGPGYFRTMGVPLLEGREFAPSDHAASEPVVIINETIRRLHFTGEEAVGRRIAFENEEPRRWLTIVGVVGDEKLESLAAPPHAELFLPMAQEGEGTVRYLWRSTVDPDGIVRAFRRAVAGLDSSVPLHEIGPVDGLVASSVARPRFLVTLIGAFATTALLLAAFGIYGVVAYGVSQRRTEIGIRIALGARTDEVVRMMAAQSIRPVLLGVALGLGAALALSGTLSSLLFGVSAQDPATLASIAILMTLLGLFSSYLPARRASRIDPVRSIRAD